MHEVMFDQQVPKPIRSLVEIRHSEIHRHGTPICRTPTPDRPVREEALVNPAITLLQFLRCHMPGPENRMGSVVLTPIAVKQTSLGFHFPEQRGGWVRCENVKGRAFQAVLLNPFRGTGKHIFTIVVEPQHKRAVYLNSVVVKEADTACVVRSFRSLLSSVGEIVVREQFEANEDSATAGHCHLADESGIIGNIDRYGRTPDLVKRTKRMAKRSQVVPARAEIVVDEHGV